MDAGPAGNMDCGSCDIKCSTKLLHKKFKSGNKLKVRQIEDNKYKAFDMNIFSSLWKLEKHK